METLIALLLASAPPKFLTDYKLNACYISNKSPDANTIKIIRITKKSYVYKIKYTTEWSKPLFNKKETIHEIYTKEIECP